MKKISVRVRADGAGLRIKNLEHFELKIQDVDYKDAPQREGSIYRLRMSSMP